MGISRGDMSTSPSGQAERSGGLAPLVSGLRGGALPAGHVPVSVCMGGSARGYPGVWHSPCNDRFHATFPIQIPIRKR